MSAKGRDTKRNWVDPDEAPEWDTEAFARAEIRQDDRVLRPADGTLTGRGRPRSENPKQLVSLRLDREVLERLRAMGPGWQTQVNAALRKVVGL
ncbi:MAG: BrnA antitoxin family protein [Sphingomonas sp.]|uniref:BrnA antitoxin family protein n=1 Tax=Sphingomonas sp. TaxID=28214 RepID=UPI0022733C8D|nr:BrnA antitoxin family protein [Sphingomonas sp.]MCX8478057.1 BrnA antitoxin family protein [Sphingomonas sp.]